MLDRVINWDLDGNQSLTLIDACDINIPINRDNYEDIFTKACHDVEFRDRIILYENRLKNIFDTANNKKNGLGKRIASKITLSFQPDLKNNRFFIGYSIPSIINNIFREMNIKTDYRDINFNDKEDVIKFKKHIEDELYFQLEVESIYSDSKTSNRYKNLEKFKDNYSYIIDVLNNVNQYLNRIIYYQIGEEQFLRENHRRLKENIKNPAVIWKNLLLYVAVNSLHQFYETGDINYYRLAKTYYTYISEPNKAEYPKDITINGKRYNYSTFNTEFEYIRDLSFPKLDIKLQIEDLPQVVTFAYPGKIEPQIDQIHPNNKTKNVSQDQYLEEQKRYGILDRKLKFYPKLRSVTLGTIKVIEKDKDYFGYVLNNNYIIFEKFYETGKNKGTMKPCKENAIYVVTIDTAIKCDFDLKKMKEYIAKTKNKKLGQRLYHTNKNSYQEKLMEVATYPNISSVSYSDLKKLTLRNN